MSDHGLENVLWPQQTHLSVMGAWADLAPSPCSSPAQGKANTTNPGTTDTSAAHLLRLNLDNNNVCVQ